MPDHSYNPEAIPETAPDCSRCLRVRFLLSQIDTGEGPYRLTKEQIQRIIRVLTLSPDAEAVNSLIREYRICPLTWLVDQPKTKVLESVQPDDCEGLDALRDDATHLSQREDA